MTKGKRIYVLDTNVLMHDPTAPFRFEEHDVFLPMTVLEELDAAKKGASEVSRNARQVSRFINELIERNPKQPISDGLELKLPKDFWDRHPELRSWSERGHTFYEVKLRKDEDWQPLEFLYLPDENDVELRVLRIKDGLATLQIIDDYRGGSHSVWGIAARNREQNFALNALMDPEIDFVTLLGTAGTGKTLLALAAGLAQTMDQQRYREIIMTRATVSVREDIGFLPGTEEEKMTPWMGALTDNLEVL